jgi:hypothetical protein
VPTATLYKRYEVPCDSAGSTCAGLIAIDDSRKQIYVAYRGSTIDRQLFIEFMHGLTAQFGAWVKFDAGGGVVSYFHRSFDKLWNFAGIGEDLEKLAVRYPNYTLVVCALAIAYFWL